MARLDWDRLRRRLPLDGADARVDPDGAILWEREVGAAREIDPRAVRDRFDASSGVRRLRAGIVVRRARERRLDEAGARHGDAGARGANDGALRAASPVAPQPRTGGPFDASAWIECPRCKARVPRRKLLMHARTACARRA